jgi:hypothetical protein
MFGGRLQAILTREEANVETLGRLMLGGAV